MGKTIRVRIAPTHSDFKKPISPVWHVPRRGTCNALGIICMTFVTKQSMPRRSGLQLFVLLRIFWSTVAIASLLFFLALGLGFDNPRSLPRAIHTLYKASEATSAVLFFWIILVFALLKIEPPLPNNVRKILALSPVLPLIATLFACILFFTSHQK